jgi:AcrR family transcriptional regulator
MKRKLKNPEKRRQEIIDCAHSLFTEKGYEQTSIENIIDAAQIAKGTFYYYFKSKKDLLTEISKQISRKMYDFIEKLLNTESFTVIEKLNYLFMSSEKNQIINPKVMEAICDVENRELQEQLNIDYIKEIVPLITNIFNQGHEKGLWRKKISLKKMQIILGGTQFILDSGLFIHSEEQRNEFLFEIETLLESIIESKKGTLKEVFKTLS